MDSSIFGNPKDEVGVLAGVDLCRPARIKRIIKRHGDRFLRRVFTEAEIEYCSSKGNPYLSYAARFAAKEATMKILAPGC